MFQNVSFVKMVMNLLYKGLSGYKMSENVKFDNILFTTVFLITNGELNFKFSK